jgi:hypothetical protein
LYCDDRLARRRNRVGAQRQRRGSMPGLDGMTASLAVWPGLNLISEALKTA